MSSKCTCSEMPAAGMNEGKGIRPVPDPNCPVHGDKAAGKPVTADSTKVTADATTTDDGNPLNTDKDKQVTQCG